MLGGCSEGDRAPAEAGAATQPDDAPVEVSAASPLDELLGVVADPLDQHRAWERYAAGYPDAMTRCMRSRGYADFAEPAVEQPSLEELRRSAATTYGPDPEVGYGVAANLALQIDNALTDRSTTDGEVPTWIRDLTAAEQQAFAEDSLGCQRQAGERFPHPVGRVVTSQAAMQELFSARQSIEGAPPMQELWREWAACMAAQGYSASTREALVRDLGERATEAVGRLEGAMRRHGGPVPPDDPVIAEVRAAEDRLAAEEARLVADDLACARPIELDERLAATRHRLEQEYVDEHGDELRALLAADDG